MKFKVGDIVEASDNEMGALILRVFGRIPINLPAVVVRVGGENGVEVEGDRTLRNGLCFQLTSARLAMPDPEFDLDDMELAEIIMEEMK